MAWKKSLKPVDSPTSPGGRTPFAVDSARIIGCRIGIQDGFDCDRMLPVVTEVICVCEGLDAALNESTNSNIASSAGLPAIMLPGIGNAIALAVHFKFEEVVVFKEHDRFDNVMQNFKTGGVETRRCAR